MYEPQDIVIFLRMAYSTAQNHPKTHIGKKSGGLNKISQYAKEDFFTIWCS